MQKVERIPRTEGFRGPDDGKWHSYPPRRHRAQEAQQSAKREGRKVAALASLLAVVVAGGLAFASHRDSDSTSGRQDNRARAEALSKAAREQVNGFVEDSDFATQALVLNSGTKIYAQSDTTSKPIMITNGIGIVEQPGREQLGKEDSYAYWYRFTMPAEEGKVPTVGWIPAAIIDDQQAGFMPNLQGQTGIVKGEHDLVSHTFSIDGEEVAQLNLYRDVVAANTAVAQKYVLPLPVETND